MSLEKTCHNQRNSHFKEATAQEPSQSKHHLHLQRCTAVSSIHIRMLFCGVSNKPLSARLILLDSFEKRSRGLYTVGWILACSLPFWPFQKVSIAVKLLQNLKPRLWKLDRIEGIDQGWKCSVLAGLWLDFRANTTQGASLTVSIVPQKMSICNENSCVCVAFRSLPLMLPWRWNNSLRQRWSRNEETNSHSSWITSGIST